MIVKKYFQPLLSDFKSNSNEVNRLAMEKYMKNKFSYFGIKSPQRKEITRVFFKQYDYPAKSDIDECVLFLWEQSQRELQYVAMELFAKFIKKSEKEYIELVEKLIITKSWWDTVDYIASNLAGVLLRNYPELKSEYIPKWLNSDNMWLQRTTLLFQLKYKQETDNELLFSLIRKLSSSKEFFIQKAIGWALREYSKTNPVIVKEFIKSNKLARLSEREGMKIINKKYH